MVIPNKIIAVIPARYASTRFLGKPLVDIGGISMIERVYRQVKKVNGIQKIVVATDDNRILDHVINFGGLAVLTSSNHQSGTDRCAEVLDIMDEQFDYLINIQGDEPFIPPALIEELIYILCYKDFNIATLVSPIKENEDIFNPNTVKAVFEKETGRAIYFSRNPVPFLRDIPSDRWIEQGEHFRHIGIYGFSTSVLKKIVALPVSRLEVLEKLEQLRWLENNYTIGVAETSLSSPSIDSPEDLEKVLRMNLHDI